MKFPAPQVNTASEGRRRRRNANTSARSRSPGSGRGSRLRGSRRARTRPSRSSAGPRWAASLRSPAANSSGRRRRAGRFRRRAPARPGRIDVHERLARPRHLEQRVAASRHVAQPPTDGDEEVSFLHPSRERRIHADRLVGRRSARAVVDVVLAAKRRDRPQSRSPRRRRPCPSPACADQPPSPTTTSGRSAAASSSPRRRQLLVTWPGRGTSVGVASAASVSSSSTSSGSASTTGPGRPARRDREGARTYSGIRAASSICADPLGERPNIARKSTSWNASRPRMSRATWPTKQDHRRRILDRRCARRPRVGRARAARDEADPRPPGELAVGLGHVGGAASWRTRRADRRVVERVEHRQVAFAGDAEGKLGAVHPSWSTSDLAAGALIDATV